MDSMQSHNTRNDFAVDDLTTQMEEGLAVKFTDDELEEAGKAIENSLVVKIMGNRSYNRAAFKKVLRDLWQPAEGLKFTEVGGNVLLATFPQESDRDRFLSRGPWRFMGWALHVEKWIPGKPIPELFTAKLQLWIQIYNLPIEYRNTQFLFGLLKKLVR